MIFNKLIPELSVSDFNRSLNFYTKILGFSIEYQREENKFAFLNLNDAQIMIEKENENWSTGEREYPYGRGINLQIEVDGVDILVKKLQKENYPIKVMPQENWYRQDNVLLGNKEFLIQDPDGYLLRFAQDLGERPLE